MKVVKFNVVDASGAAAVGATIGMGNTEVKTAAGGVAQMLLDDGDVILTVNGKKVWMHTVYAKYGVDFIKQDGEWKIWHFHCFEVARAPYGMGWIPFAAAAQDSPFADDLMYFGEDGKPVMMPKPDGPATIRHNPYRTDRGQTLDLQPPVPYRTFSETFAY